MVTATTKWTQVTPKNSSKRYNQSQQTAFDSTLRDPFAGMNSNINYEKEIERLKQLLVEKPASTTSSHTTSKRSKRSHNNTSSSTSSISTTSALHHSPSSSMPSSNVPSSASSTASTSSSSSLPSYSRSSSPTSSSISSASSLPDLDTTPTNTHCILTADELQQQRQDKAEAVVTEEEKLRFLAFVRHWTGDYYNRNMMMSATTPTTPTTPPSSTPLPPMMNAFDASYSLWADQSPWSRPIDPSYQQQKSPFATASLSAFTDFNHTGYYYNYQPTHIAVNQHGQLPIGMGRRRLASN